MSRVYLPLLMLLFSCSTLLVVSTAQSPAQQLGIGALDSAVLRLID
jgi:hypothetical protein